MKLISASLKSAGLRQRAFFSFPPPQQRPASGPNAVRRVGHLNAVHKGALLRHRNLGNEQRTIVLVSGVSFSCKYSATLSFRKSVPFGTVTSSPQRIDGKWGTVSPPVISRLGVERVRLRNQSNSSYLPATVTGTIVAEWSGE